MNKKETSAKTGTKKTSGSDEMIWRQEMRNLRQLSRLLWQDIQKLESLYCLDVKNKVNFYDELRRFEISLIKTALLQTGGSQHRSAKLLGVSPASLNNKIKRYGISLGTSDKLALTV